MADVWIGLATGVSTDSPDGDAGGAVAHVLAPADDEQGLLGAATQALAEHGFRLTELEDAEPVRERLAAGGLSPDLMALALDAALEGAVQIGDLYLFPAEDAEDAEDAPDLHVLLETRTLVNVRRARDVHDTIGYIVAIGERWALVQIVDACGSADGVRALRVGTFDEAEPVEAQASFLPRLLEAQPLAAIAPALDLGDTRALLEGAQRRCALIYLATDGMQPGAFWVGQISALDDDGVLLEKVSALGAWDGSEHFPYGEIIRVGFGGRYEDALATALGAVSGE